MGAVQCLTIYLPMQGTGFDLWSRKIPHALEQLSPCTRAMEPVHPSPGPTTGESTGMRSHAPQLDSPCPTMKIPCAAIETRHSHINSFFKTLANLKLESYWHNTVNQLYFSLKNNNKRVLPPAQCFSLCILHIS